MSFLLRLGPSVSVPVVLTNTSTSQSTSLSLETIVAASAKGPPGKFYVGLAVLDALRTPGPAAQIVPSSDSTDENKSHFEQFRTRLGEGNLASGFIPNVYGGLVLMTLVAFILVCCTSGSRPIGVLFFR